MWQAALLVVSVEHWSQLWIDTAATDLLRRAWEGMTYKFWGFGPLKFYYWASRNAMIPIYSSLSGHIMEKKKKKFKRMQKLRLRIYCFADQMQLFSKYLTHKFQKFCWEECHKLLCPQTRLCWKKERRTTRYTEWQAKKPSHPAME